MLVGGGLAVARQLRQGILIRGHRAEAQHLARAAVQAVDDQFLGLLDLPRIGIQKEEATHADGMLGSQIAGTVEVQLAGLFLEERLRQTQGYAGTVARIAAHAAAMFHRHECKDGPVQNLVAGRAVFRCHGTDAAGILADGVRVQECLRFRELPAESESVHRRVRSSADSWACLPSCQQVYLAPKINRRP